MVYGRLAVCILAGATAVGSQAAAQEVRSLDFQLHAEAEHNTNVTRSTKLQAETLNLSPADNLYTPSASVDFFTPVGRQSVFLKGSAGYTFYQKNTKLNRERLDFTGGLNAPIGPCRGTVTGYYGRGLRQLEDPELITDVNNIQEVKRASANLGCSQDNGLGVVASASKSWITNSQAFLIQSDYETSSLMAGVSYARPALGTFTLFADRQETEYPNRVLGGGYTMTSVGITAARQLGARIQGTVTVAQATVKQDNSLALAGSDLDRSTVTYSGSLSYRVSSRLRADASFNNSITPSTSFGRSYDKNTGYRLSASYDIGSRFVLSLGGAKIDRTSEGAIQIPSLLTDSSTTSVFGTLRYNQSERISFLLSGGQEKRTTNTPQFDYTSARIGLAVDARF